jgi:hypothetical protein
MKNLFALLSAVAVLSLSACQHEDIWDKLNEHDQRIEKLEEQCSKLNTNIEALRTIVMALQQNEAITDVSTVVENGVVVGYKVTFSRFGTITILNGANSNTPMIGVKKHSDGLYYWTCNGEWLTDDQGNMISASVAGSNGNSIVPQFRITDGLWYLSYDNGKTWKKMDVLMSEEYNFIKSVTQDESYVYFTHADGTKIAVPKLANKYATTHTAAEDELVAKIRDNVDANTVVFLLMSDTHASDAASYEQSAVARKLAERIGVDAIVHLGDMIDENPKSGTDGSLDRLMRYMEGTAASNIPFLHAIGHHEKYGSVIYPANEADFRYYLTNNLVAGITVRGYDKHLHAVRDAANVFNYYVDFDFQQLRCIFVDSVYMRWGMDEHTISWIKDTVNDTPEDYKIMFFSHVSPVAKANFKNELVNDDLLQNMLNEGIEPGHTILGWAHGHTHADNVVYCDEVDFPVIGTACSIDEGDSKGANSPKYDQNLVFYSDRKTGTLNQYLIDVLCINPSTGMLKYFRFGAGKDRIVDALNPEPSVGESVYIETAIGGIAGATGVQNNANIRSRSVYFTAKEANLVYSVSGEWYLYAYSGDNYVGILQDDGTFGFTSETSNDRTIGPGERIDLRNFNANYKFRVCGYPDASNSEKKVTSSTKDMWSFYLL